jgi:uncharacterized protein YgiM (DUF1202 family)
VRDYLIPVLIVTGMFLHCGDLVAQGMTFAGVINANHVNVRAGYDTNFEILTQMDKGDKVIVNGESGGWYSIKPPLNTSCYVSADLVQIKDGEGLIRGSNVNVRAGSGLQFTVLGQLNKDDSVTIRSVEKNWVRIGAPVNCKVWVKSEFVDRYSTVEQYLNEEKRKEEARSLFRKTEGLFLAETSKENPLEMDLAPVANSFRQVILLGPDLPEAKEARQRLREIELRLAQIELVKTKKLLEAKQKEIERRDEEPVPLAVGVVEDTGKYINRPGTHKLLVNGMPAYYMKSDKVDLNRYVYARVKVWGGLSKPSEKDLPVIVVEKVKVSP